MADKQSFEEQVRNELAGFAIGPEAFVWENVERSLQKDKKRRWVIWFFLFGIAGSAASYWMYHQFKTPAGIEAKQVVAKNTAPANSTEHNERKTPQVITVPIPLTPTGEEKTKLTISKKVTAEISIPKNSITDIVNGSTTEQNKSAQGSTIAENEDDNKKILAKIEKEKDLMDEKDTQLKENFDSANNVGNKKNITSVDDSAATASIVKPDKKPIVKKNNPWKLSAIVDLGQSALWYKSFYTPAPLNAATPPSTIVTPAYSGETGSAFSFGAGIDAEKKLGKKWDIGISLAYQYYASKIRVGTKVNSVLGFQNSFNSLYAVTNSGYYLAAADQTYTNAYHLVETGLSFYRNYKLSNSFFLRWQSGIAGAWLFSSSALHYDESKNIFYKDNSLLHGFQVNLSTALEAGIGKAQRIFIGPQFTYFPTTNSVQTSRYDYRNLVRIGVRTHVLLSKNKQKK